VSNQKVAAQKLQTSNERRADARKAFLSAVGTVYCACGHTGQAHIASGSMPCSMCNCMGFKDKKANKSAKICAAIA
jgi:hypothetical protein